VQKALHGSSVLQKIQWDGAAQAFAVHLVNHLDQYGEISPGTPALAALLEEVKTLAGTNRQAEVDRLLAQLKALPASTECVGADSRAMPKALQALLDQVRDNEGGIDLSPAEAQAIKTHNPADLTEYRLCRIAEWSLPRYYLDKRFVNLTLLLDKGESEHQRWQRAEDFRFNDLRDVLKNTPNDPALVLLGAPGSGKSTLLRRLQL